MVGEELAGDFPAAIDLEQLHRLPTPIRPRGRRVDEHERDRRQRLIVQNIDVLEALRERRPLDLDTLD